MNDQENLAQQTLSLELYLLTPALTEEQAVTSDATIDIILSENLMAELCQNPADEQTNCLYIQDYKIQPNNQQHAEILTAVDSVQLHINHGPSLGVLVECGEQLFVSEQISYMPEFDLGLDEDDA